MFSPIWILIQQLYLASDEAFKKSSCIAARHEICTRFKFTQLGRHCINWIICGHITVPMQALLSDTCCVRRTQCISLNLSLRPATVGCVFNKTWKQKLINSYVLVLGDIDNDFPNTDRLAKLSAVCARKLVYVCVAPRNYIHRPVVGYR